MSGLAELLVRQGYARERLGPGRGRHHPAPGGPGGPRPLWATGPKTWAAPASWSTPPRSKRTTPVTRPRARGPGALPCCARGQMLARLMEGHTQVAVTGMHGKTSTTAMTAAVLRAGNLDPTVVGGLGLGRARGPNAVLGRGRGFAWPSPTSPTAPSPCSTPEITIITNLDREHLDYYRDLAHVQEMFAAYVQRLPQGARVIACADDPQPGPDPRPLPPRAGHLQPEAGVQPIFTPPT